MSAGDSFSFETVFSHESKLDFLEEARRVGFEVFLHFIAVESTLINVERVRTRVSLGGHSVPEDRIVARYGRTMELLPEMILRSDKAWIFDNSEWLSDLISFKGRLVATTKRATDGRIQIFPRRPLPAWTRRYLIEPARLRRSSFKVSDLAAEADGDHRPTVMGRVAHQGSRLIVDLYGAECLSDVDRVESTLRECVEAAGATLLHIHLHRFDPDGGLSGVAVLAESHISIHTWPKVKYAAIDIFMIGETQPDKCVPVLRERFNPKRVAVSEIAWPSR